MSKLFTGLFVVTRLRIIYRSLSSRHRISAECLNILSIPQLYLLCVIGYQYLLTGIITQKSQIKINNLFLGEHFLSVIMLRFRQEYSLTAIYCTLQQDHFHEKRLTYRLLLPSLSVQATGAATSAGRHVTKSGEPAGFGVSGCESFPRRSEYSNPPPDRVAILTCPLLPPIDIFLYTLTVTSFHLIQPHVPD